MKRKYFSGVAVHPKRVDPRTGTMVGVWLYLCISESQRRELMSLNQKYAPGHIGVRVGRRGTAVMYLGPANNEVDARRLAASLVRSVSEVTGVVSILRQLPNYREVSRALAV